MFTGLSAFPLTPIRDDGVDEPAFAALVGRLRAADVDSIAVLGSTGSYAYLGREERAAVVRLALEHAGDVPVIAGIGHARTREVLRHLDDAQRAGVAGVLLAPVTYQPLTDDDVLGLFEDVSRELSVPLIVYDNPRTTHVEFTDELYAGIAALPGVASLKIPGLPADPVAAGTRVNELRALLGEDVTIGISGDAGAAAGLAAGCDAWYSVLAGTLPEPALAITRAIQAGDLAGGQRLSDELAPLWELFAVDGSLRVIAAIAEHLGLVAQPCLPRPLLGLSTDARASVVASVSTVL